MRSPTPACALAFRVLVAGWLLGWTCKGFLLVTYLFVDAFRWPVARAGFPAALSHPALSAVAYALPLVALVPAWRPRLLTMRVASGVMAVCSLALCLHLNTFNDATFVTSTWTALWGCWLSANAYRDDARFERHARRLAQAVPALMFLGGAVGKLTPEYWSGEAFHHLYLLQSRGWPYVALRHALGEPALGLVARWWSRATIGLELALVALPALPYRVALVVGTCGMAAIVALTTPYLLSVFACLAAVLLAPLAWERERRRSSAAVAAAEGPLRRPSG